MCPKINTLRTLGQNILKDRINEEEGDDNEGDQEEGDDDDDQKECDHDVHFV